LFFEKWWGCWFPFAFTFKKCSKHGRRKSLAAAQKKNDAQLLRHRSSTEGEALPFLPTAEAAYMIGSKLSI
jgi:hypothetical protein